MRKYSRADQMGQVCGLWGFRWEHLILWIGNVSAQWQNLVKHTSLLKIKALFFAFQSCNCGIWMFPGWGSNHSCSCQPAPQPEQCGIQLCLQDPSQARAMPDLQPTEQGQGSNHILMDTSQIHLHCATMGTHTKLFLKSPDPYAEVLGLHIRYSFLLLLTPGCHSLSLAALFPLAL